MKQVIFPTYAWKAGDQWRSILRIWCVNPDYRFKLKGLLINQFKKHLGLKNLSKIFVKRIGFFLGDNLPDIIPQISSMPLTKLSPSQPNGMSVTPISVSTSEINTIRKTVPIFCLNPKGVSIISDIDDTIKESKVWNKKELLTNTFCRPMKSIPGMAKKFASYAEEGAAIHYVSSSPWQLYETLQDFLTESGFPPGSFNLKDVRLKSLSILKLLQSPKKYKTDAIAHILSTFPERSFVLLGDDAEQDAWVYQHLTKQFKNIVRIWIRKTGAPARKAQTKLLRDHPSLTLFQDGNDLPQTLRDLLV